EFEHGQAGQRSAHASHRTRYGTRGTENRGTEPGIETAGKTAGENRRESHGENHGVKKPRREKAAAPETAAWQWNRTGRGWRATHTHISVDRTHRRSPVAPSPNGRSTHPPAPPPGARLRSTSRAGWLSRDLASSSSGTGFTVRRWESERQPHSVRLPSHKRPK